MSEFVQYAADVAGRGMVLGLMSICYRCKVTREYEGPQLEEQRT